MKYISIASSTGDLSCICSLSLDAMRRGKAVWLCLATQKQLVCNHQSIILILICLLKRCDLTEELQLVSCKGWWAHSKCTNRSKIHLWLETYNTLYCKCSHKLDFCFICLKTNRSDFQYFNFRAHKFDVFAICFPSDYSTCIKLVVVVVVCQWRAALRLKYVMVFLLRCFCVTPLVW